MITKKHFTKIAEILQRRYISCDEKGRVILQDIIYGLVKVFQEENPNFNAKGFIRACTFSKGEENVVYHLGENRCWPNLGQDRSRDS